MTPIEGAGVPLARAGVSKLETPAGALSEAGEENPFSDILESAVAGANQQIKGAEELAESFASGQRDDIHGTMLAISKADIELRLVGGVKNKIVDAFYELWRMQI